MIDASSFSNQEVKSAALLAIVVLWVLYLFVMRRFSIGFGILAIGLVLCSQYSQNPALPEHLSPCVGTAVVIGVSPGGIGLPTAIVLAQRGCKVVMAGRSMERLKAAEIELKQQVPNVQSLVFTVDLADFDSVSRFADELLEHINVIEYLILNAGTMFEGSLTKDGWNTVSQVNHLSQFHLTTNLLLPALVRVPNGKARVVVVASGAALVPRQSISEIDWLESWRKPAPSLGEQFQHYAESKLANVLFAKSLSDRFGHVLKAYSVHPGFIVSMLYRQILPDSLVPIIDKVSRVVAKSTEAGAHVSVIAALDPTLENRSGVFLGSDGEIFDYPHRVKMDSATASTLWEASLKALAQKK